MHLDVEASKLHLLLNVELVPSLVPMPSDSSQLPIYPLALGKLRRQSAGYWYRLLRVATWKSGFRQSK
jgi:hypothetical protein